MANTLELLNAARGSLRDNLPTATLYQTAAQSINSASTTPIQFGAAANDNWSGWSSGSNTRWTVPMPGVYLVTGVVIFNLTATGVIISLVEKNGSENLPGQVQIPVTGSGILAVTTPPITISAAVGDYFQLGAYQTTGTAQSTTATSQMASYMTISFLRNP